MDGVANQTARIDKLIGMPWDEYMAELEHQETYWRDESVMRALKAMRLATSLPVYRALIEGQPVPSSQLNQQWLKRYA